MPRVRDDAAKGQVLQALSERAALRYGLLLALLLGAALATMLVHDRSSRIDAAKRDTATLAEATAGLVHYAMRDIERALLSAARGSARRLADSGPDQLSAVPIQELVEDRAELAAIVVYDASGRALSP